MPLRMRRRRLWTHPAWGNWHHHGYAPCGPIPLGPWCPVRMSVEEEKVELNEYIETLKEELEAAKETLEELEKSE